jgi:hypothetical protein
MLPSFKQSLATLLIKKDHITIRVPCIVGNSRGSSLPRPYFKPFTMAKKLLHKLSLFTAQELNNLVKPGKDAWTRFLEATADYDVTHYLTDKEDKPIRKRPSTRKPKK